MRQTCFGVSPVPPRPRNSRGSVLRGRTAHVGFDRRRRGAVDHDRALLVALAGNTDRPFRQVDVGEPDARDLRAPNAARVEQLQDRGIAETRGIVRPASDVRSSFMTSSTLSGAGFRLATDGPGIAKAGSLSITPVIFRNR